MLDELCNVYSRMVSVCFSNYEVWGGFYNYNGLMYINHASILMCIY